jgi:hypothetical protein
MYNMATGVENTYIGWINAVWKRVSNFYFLYILIPFR